MSKNRIAGVNVKNMAHIYETMATTMPQDQIYRETVKNSFESGARQRERDPNYKGTVIVRESEHHAGKICVMDDAEGMPKNKILSLTGDLAETLQQSDDGNFGHGTKAAAFANHKYGILYHSLYVEDKGKGSGVHMEFDGQDYGARYLDQYQSCILPMEREDFPDLIKDAGHGNMITLMGNSEEENTLNPPEKYEKNSLLGSGRTGVHWLAASLNTKFYEIPDYMTLSVQIKRKDRSNLETIKGHKYVLNQHSDPDKRGTLDFKIAKIHWWLLGDQRKRDSRNDCVLNGHLGILHKKEILKIDFNAEGKKNPLKTWGLPFSYKGVAMIVEFKNFHSNLQRTTLHSDAERLEYTEYLPDLRDLFIQNMPSVLADNEAKMQTEYSRKQMGNESLMKKISQYLKKLFALEHPTGEARIDTELPLEGAAPIDQAGVYIKRKKRKRKRLHHEGEEFGPDPITIGLKNLEGRKKANPARPNCWPEFKIRSDNTTDVEYDFDHHKCYLWDNSSIIDEYTRMVEKQTKHIQFKTLRDLTIGVIGDLLCTRIAVTRARDFLNEDEKRELLANDQALFMILMSPFEIVEKVLEKTKNLSKHMKELNGTKVVPIDSTRINAGH
tara:strand:- start:538 stop:2373 length:1836 start_codon:yes stop_codon:yes gene_type:complete